jgi:FtsZ-interacting cell division protein ZipA
MDLNTITIILAIITIVPTVGGLIIQARREKKQAELDKMRAEAQEEIDKTNAASAASTVATTATSSVIVTLQSEVERLNKRVAELEISVLDKTTRIGELMMAKIDSEATSATMKYKMESMQLKLDSIVINPEIKNSPSPKQKKAAVVPLKLKQTLLSLEEQKEKIAKETNLEIEHLKNNSITNNKINL